MSFVHLHFHTTYSFLDGYNLIDRAMKRLKELGQTACAITDHGHLGGCPEFKNACNKNGIKPLLGTELYYTNDIKEITKDIKIRRREAFQIAESKNLYAGMDVKKMTNKAVNEICNPFMYDTRSYHILMIAKNQTGWNNLVKIQSIGSQSGSFNGRAHCDMNLLREYHEGIICTTACIGSYPSKCIQNGNIKEATRYIEEMQSIFGDDFYLEIQPLNIDKQRMTNIFYMQIAKRLNIKCIATNDVHYTLKEDHDDHDTLLCIGLGKNGKKNNPDRMHYSNDFWIKSEDEMRESFSEQLASTVSDYSMTQEDIDEYNAFWENALTETNNVADKVIDEIEFGSNKPLFSNVKVQKGRTAESTLRQKAWRGLYAYLSKHKECDVHEYEERLAEELDIIIPKGFSPYFLAVEEYVTWANANGCPTGPGRGSAAGSLVLLSIGVTKIIDPIKYKLWFSRFMTKDRVEPPDIDIDFSWEHREDVFHHLKDYYGKEHVAHIGTYTVEGVKSGITDICRVFEYPVSTAKALTNKISEIAGGPTKVVTFKMLDTLAEGDENEKSLWNEFHQLEVNNQEIFRLARTFEGVHRNCGVHASGVLVTPMPITDMFPVRYSPEGDIITYYTGPQLEEYGAVKYDILGLKTVDVIQKTIKNIDKDMTLESLYEKVDISDPEIYDMITKKETEAVFQLGSGLMKGIIEKIKPTGFNDVIAVTSLGRPGPISEHLDQDYASVKHGERNPSYPIRGCEDILDETYGVICYQEQLMAISRKVSGFDDSQADSITRKTVAKKKKAMLPLFYRSHIYGKINAKGPEGWEDDEHSPWYDETGHFGPEIKGAIANGYSEEEMLDYFKTIEGYSSYCFNKSHAASYSYISILTSWLKHYYPVEFMAAVLTMEKDPDKFTSKLSLAENMGIKITVPDASLSGIDFTPCGDKILYGLGSVKGLGGAVIPSFLAAQPFESIEDAMKKLGTRIFKKNVGEGLIKSGAFDSIEKESNRNILLNKFYDLRKDKKSKVPRLNPEEYSEDVCISYEEDSFGKSITYKRWWDGIPENKTIDIDVSIVEMKEREDKRNNMMAFFTLQHLNSEFPAIMFSSSYCKYAGLFMGGVGTRVKMRGKKNSKDTFQISSAYAC